MGQTSSIKKREAYAVALGAPPDAGRWPWPWLAVKRSWW